MADFTGNATPGELVKRFSWEMENRENLDGESEEFTQLRRDLVEHTKIKSSESEAEMARLERYFSETSFQSLIPEELRTTTIPTSWSDVETAVSTVQKHWESQAQGSKTSKAGEWFRKMCNGLHNHKALLDLLPKESEYVSVIAGAVTMIIKASANYTKISESFANGITAINDAVALVQGNQVYHTPCLQELSMRLYTGVFGYLRKFMTWFTSKKIRRLLWSMNENLEQTFAGDLQQVKGTSVLISQQIQLYMSIDVRISKLQSQGTRGDLKHLVDLVENGEAQRRLQVATTERLFEEMLSKKFKKSSDELQKMAAKVLEGFNEALRQTISGQAMGNILEQQAAVDIDTGGQQSSSALARFSDECENEVPIDQSLPSPSQQDDDIKLWSAHLEDYYSSEQIYPFPETPQQVYAGTAFVSRLSEFTTTLESQVLYATTHFRPEALNLLRLSAAKYASLARTHDIPVLSFFCSALPDDPDQQIALLYALIRQAVELLNDSTSALAGITEARFKLLDGTVETWETALQVFSGLVRSLQLPQLLFIIDGANLLEDDSDDAPQERMRGLVRALKDLACPGALRDELPEVAEKPMPKRLLLQGKDFISESDILHR
ncbi:hypothetical protein Daus18300_011432 [Diaporthe australafricana]|uniref:DUF7708 domain-containing protein n=1 Tax=Diaporthe australafricana TaxID=127596 RepID=A0ABR3W6I4_9PEZI